MKREWKPGDVGIDRDDGTVCLLVSKRGEACNEWHPDASHWHYAEGDWNPVGVDSVRPLVVLDPEDRETASRIRHALPLNPDIADVQHALRSLIAPPKPRCVAHGNEECVDCSRISGTYLTGEGGCSSCSVYIDTGMHWDTCPGRIKGRVYANRAEAEAGDL